MEADGTPHFEADVHVWTADGRLDWTLPVRGELRRRPGKAPSLALYRTQYSAAEDVLWSSSLRHVDLFGAAGAEVQLGAGYGLADGADHVEGRVFVSAVPECSRDNRCELPNAMQDGRCTECGTPINVTEIQWTK